MTSTHSPSRLHFQLAHMIGLETTNEQMLEELIPEVSMHAGVKALLTSFKNLTRAHRDALETRLETLKGAAPLSKGTTRFLPVDRLSHEADYPVTTALQIMYTMFDQSIIGYSVLHSLSTRFLDSLLVADEGTSYHLARQHTQDYVRAIEQISCLIHDVVLWELDQEGLECQCTCPSCEVGICLCALAGRSFLRDTWVEVGRIADDEGVYVQQPKQNSVATKAGLRRGDVILAVNDQEIESYGDLQSTVRNAKPGQEIRLTVRRDSDGFADIAIAHP